MATTSPGPAIAASFRFLGPAWSRAYGPLLAVIAINVGYRLAAAAAPALALLWDTVLLLLSLYFGTTAGGALYRIALAPDHAGDASFELGPAGFQWGRLEWRVLGARILFGVLVGGAVFIVFMMWAIALGVLIAAKQVDPNQITSAEGVEVLMRLMRSPAGPVTALILGPGFVAVFYIYARLLLLPIMAAETGAFGVGRALALTRGATVAIMVGALVVSVGAFVLGAVGGAAGGFIRGVLGVAFRLPAGFSGSAFWGALAGAALGAVYSAPATVGLVSYVYRRQRGETQGVAEAFS